jgi:putative ABC transport system permease protein
MRVLPAGTVAAALGDLFEDYGRRRQNSGRLRANVWLFGEVRSLERSYRGAKSRRLRAACAALSDWRIALRSLGRRPGFTAASALMLMVGLGASAASWTIFDALLLRPLPYPSAERLVLLSSILPGESSPSGSSLSFRDTRDLAERVAGLDAIAAFWESSSLQVSTAAGPEGAVANFVQGRYFELLGARPALGRLIGTGDDTAPGQNPVVVVSHAFWRNRLGASPAAVGSTLPVNGRPFTVIGVMAADFADVPFESGSAASGGRTLDLWFPSSMLEIASTPTAATARNMRIGHSVARLRADATLAAVRQQIDTAGAQLEAEFPDTNRRIRFWADPVADYLYRDIRRPLWLVLAASLTLLTIGSLNVGGLLLVRQQERRSEWIVRIALGGSRAHLAGLTALETAVLVGVSLMPAAVIAAGFLAVVRRTAPLAFPRLLSASFGMSTGLALAGLAAVSILAMLAVAWPGIMKLRYDVTPSATRSATADRQTLRWQHTLVVIEVALAVVLLIHGTLVVASLWRLGKSDVGFNPARLMTMQVSLRSERYANNAAVTAFTQGLVDAAAHLPGVESAALWGPGRPGSNVYVVMPVAERDAGLPEPERRVVWRHNISAGALAAVGIPLITGREFARTDIDSRPYVAVVSETMAKTFWPGEDPIGQRFTLITPAVPKPWYTVVGVARDARQRGRLDATPQLDFYQYLDQRPERMLTLLLRSRGTAEAVLPSARTAVASIDPDLALRDPRSMDAQLYAEGAALRFASLLLTAYAALAFALSMCGAHALVSYLVAMRAREWALRQALGATPGRLARRLVAGCTRLGVIGVGLGLAAAWLSARYLQSVLFDVEASRRGIFVAIAIGVLGATALLGIVLSRRVGLTDPAKLLRGE